MKKFLILIITILLFLSSCNKEEKIIMKKYYKTAIVQSWNILENNMYIWYTDSFNNIYLSPKVWWKIVSITKNVWDKVKVWEIIATLDSLEAKTWYSSNNEIIKNLENMKSSTSKMYDSQIEVINKKISQALTQVDISKIWVLWNKTWINDIKNNIDSQIKTIDSQIKTADIQLMTAKLNLENTKNSLNQKENNIYNNSINAITNANILSDNILDFLDNLFGITQMNKHKAESYDVYISAKNSNLKNEIKNEFNSISIKLNELKKLPLDSNENIKIALEKYNDVFSTDIRYILKKAFLAMENSIESTNFLKSTIDYNKNQILSFQSQNEEIILTVSWNYFLWLKWNIDNINNFIKEKKSNLDLLEKQVELNELQLNTLLKNKEQIITVWVWQINDISTKTKISKKQEEQSNNILEEAKVQIEVLKKQKLSSLAEIDTQISRVKSWKNDSLVMIENWKVSSLIEWVVTKKLSEVWSVIWAWMPILMVSNDKNIKIEIQVPNDILQKIILFDKVKIEIDWISEQKEWTITKIFPTRDAITKKTTLEITVDNKKNDIKIWSYSKVYFNFWKNNNWIIIPNSAIYSKYMIPQVFVIENWISKLKNIQIIKQNDNFSQIIWLNVWEEIIIDWKENIYDWENLIK